MHIYFQIWTHSNSYLQWTHS